MARKLGLCTACKKTVSYTHDNIFFGSYPRYICVEGYGVFHKSCWEKFQKSIIHKKKFGLELGVSGPKVTYGEESF